MLDLIFQRFDWGFLGLKKSLYLNRELLFFHIYEPENVVIC